MRYLMIAATWAVLAGPMLAQRSRLEQESLEFIDAFLVDIVGLTEDAERDGLQAATLRADIDSVLRQIGLGTLSEPEWQVTFGNPALHLTFQFAKPSDRFYIYSVTLEVRQLTRLMRDSTKMVYTRTWSGGNLLGAMPATNLPSLRAQVHGLLREFARAMRAARVPGRRAHGRSRLRGAAWIRRAKP